MGLENTLKEKMFRQSIREPLWVPTTRGTTGRSTRTGNSGRRETSARGGESWETRQRIEGQTNRKRSVLISWEVREENRRSDLNRERRSIIADATVRRKQLRERKWENKAGGGFQKWMGKDRKRETYDFRLLSGVT